ncbi:tetratricopeptide (TPR) repeat protein [Azospirillum agricola]|uniref:tetratricopeptide repeat protein n=1 Tax=Azospirillum agricola TaxID=1720247 RepID=UPI002D7E6F00|nr:tetratricopeptide repeat protein [Azospirillum agricola]MBP2229551.1 tetratricopeptide (TPR) repeat protein [Azospirillum agricola]
MPITDGGERRSAVTIDIRTIMRAHQQGELDGAEAGYRAFLEGQPDHVQALQMLGLLLMQRRRPAEAVDVFRRVVDAQPSVPDHWANFGGMLRAAGRAEDAGNAHRRALALAPAHGAAAFNLANLLGPAPPDGAGRPLDAEAWYERVLAVTPNHKQARNNLDVLWEKNAGRFEAAARRLIALEPASIRAHESLARTLLPRSGLIGWCSSKARDFDLDAALAAFDHLRAVQAIHPDESGTGRLWRALALDLLQLGKLDDGRLERVARAAWRQLRVAPRDVLCAALVGYHVCRRGRLGLASRLQVRFASRFTTAEIEADPELGYWSMLRADDGFLEQLPPVDSVLARLPALETLVDGTGGEAGATGPVILLSGDEIYARRFGPKLLQSIADHSPGVSVVLNLVSPSAAMLDLVADWRRHYPLSFGVSCERPDLSGWSQHRRSTYFACARFVRAFQWHRRLDRPVIVLDLDAEVRGDLRRLAEEMAGQDVGLLLDGRRRGPFREILAGFVCYNDTPPARRFLETVAAYIGHFLLDAEPRWMLDQTAHLAAHHRFRHADPPLRIRWHDFQTFAHCAFIGEK